MAASIDLTDTIIFTDLRAFLLDVLPDGVEVVQGQVNRVAEPTGPNFAVFWPTWRNRLATNVTVYDPDLSQSKRQQSVELHVQLDIHGPNGTDNANIVATLFRDDYACRFFAAQGHAVAPLHATDGQQMPFVNGEMQYEDRWIMELLLQVNPIVSTPQEFATMLALDLVEVDATYPPGAP